MWLHASGTALIQLWDRNKFWPRGVPSGYMKPVVDQVERTSLCTFVDLLGKCFHRTQCTRVSTCIPHGPTMGLLVHCTARRCLDRWRRATFVLDEEAVHPKGEGIPT